MSVLGIDLGGTKLSFALFSKEGDPISRELFHLEKRTGKDVGTLITENIKKYVSTSSTGNSAIESIGISVPGIYRSARGTVWAPNIPGWDDYPLLDEARGSAGNIPVFIDSDRACSILGETWKGNARGCRNAVFIAVGTGIGAGILVNGEILRGQDDIAGATGWMALNYPFLDKYRECGCFEYNASGEGIVKVAKEILMNSPSYHGELSAKADHLTSMDIFIAADYGDIIATRVLDQCIGYWGMAIANFVSIFNPEKVILGGGVLGPGAKYILRIREETEKWAQPISMKLVSLEVTALSGDAAVYGAARLALYGLAKHTEENA